MSTPKEDQLKSLILSFYYKSYSTSEMHGNGYGLDPFFTNLLLRLHMTYVFILFFVFSRMTLVDTNSVTSQNNRNLIQGIKFNVYENKTADAFMKELHGACLGVNLETNPEYLIKYTKQFSNRLSMYKEAFDIKRKIAKKVQEILEATWDSFEQEQIFHKILKDAGDMCSVRDCSEVFLRKTGLHTIDASYNQLFQVMCNMDVDGGNWTVIQQRFDGSVNFTRTWQEYKNGFGNLEGEFWLGNDKIHRLTSRGRYELRVDIGDWNGNNWYALYKLFEVGNEDSKYQLIIGKYTGNAGNSMEIHNHMHFSTSDQDNDISDSHCSLSYHGGWWYKKCHLSNLNGLYRIGIREYGVSWYHAKRAHYSMKFARMMIRRY